MCDDLQRRISVFISVRNVMELCQSIKTPVNSRWTIPLPKCPNLLFWNRWISAALEFIGRLTDAKTFLYRSIYKKMSLLMNRISCPKPPLQRSRFEYGHFDTSWKKTNYIFEKLQYSVKHRFGRMMVWLD
jgi:hypothetical protein